MENLLSKEEMNAVINGDHGNVFAVLGIHRDKGSKEVFIRTYQPNTKSVELLKKDGSSLGMMTKLDKRGFYQINLGQIENFPYKFRIENDRGDFCEQEDAYRFSSILGDIDIYLFAEGNHLDMYKNSARMCRKWMACAVSVLPFGRRMPNVFPLSEISITGTAALM